MHYYSVNIMLYLLFIFNKPEEKVMTLSIMEDRYSKENGMPALAETLLNNSTQGRTPASHLCRVSLHRHLHRYTMSGQQWLQRHKNSVSD